MLLNPCVVIGILILLIWLYNVSLAIRFIRLEEISAQNEHSTKRKEKEKAIQKEQKIIPNITITKPLESSLLPSSSSPSSSSSSSSSSLSSSSSSLSSLSSSTAAAAAAAAAAYSSPPFLFPSVELMRHPIHTFNACDNLFGIGSAVCNPNDKGHGDCISHAYVDWTACALGKGYIDPKKISGSIGNESIASVMGRTERAERADFGPGALILEGKRPVDFMKFLNRPNYIRGVMTSATNSISLESKNYGINQSANTTLLLVRRIDYVNPCWFISSVYSVFLAILYWKLPAVEIAWLDGHARGAFDSIWEIFFGKVSHIHSIEQGWYSDIRIVSSLSAFNDKGYYTYSGMKKKYARICSKSSLLHLFREFVYNKLQIKKIPKPKQVTLLVRRDYRAHPRSDGITDRKLENEAVAKAMLKEEWPNRPVKVFAFENMSFKEQVQIIAETDILVAVHGAGNIHVLFLPLTSTFIEYVPVGFERRLRFQYIASCLGIKHESRPAGISKKNGSKITVSL